MTCKQYIIAAFALITAQCGTITPAPAQSICARRNNILSVLSTKYSEVPVARGLAVNGAVLEVLASKDGSWTIIFTRPNGVSCVLAAGQAWESITPAPLPGTEPKT